MRSIVHFEDYYWFIVSRVVIPFPFVLFINACSHFSLSKKIIIFLSIFHLEHCALDISTRWNRTSMLFDFPYIVICCIHYWPYMADNRATSLLSVLSYQYSFFVGSVVMMTCFWTKHHPISQFVTYFFTYLIPCIVIVSTAKL